MGGLDLQRLTGVRCFGFRPHAIYLLLAWWHFTTHHSAGPLTWTTWSSSARWVHCPASSSAWMAFTCDQGNHGYGATSSLRPGSPPLACMQVESADPFLRSSLWSMITMCATSAPSMAAGETGAAGPSRLI